ncbi:hypothetical protein QUF64_11085 [Anaerolineales bacterium HSG6]|nr:hypothetical protein [Anaerolineales bacterium HSG6]MDM8529581.1 hypothetical protein [Anaerolineales bacterium HSG25]
MTESIKQLYERYIKDLSPSDKQQLVDLINQELSPSGSGLPISFQTSQGRAALKLFRTASSYRELVQGIALFPFLVETDFLADLEQVITFNAPETERDQLLERLIWLRRIAKVCREPEPEVTLGDDSDASLNDYQTQLIEYNQLLNRFEERYALSTLTFYQKFQAGHLNEIADFIDWSSLFEMQQGLLDKITEKLEILDL